MRIWNAVCGSRSLWTLALLLLVSLGCPADAGDRYELGQQLPNWRYKTLAGQSGQLSDHGGKKVVLAFMVHGSGACNAVVRKLEKDIWKAYGSSKVVVIGVMVRSRRARDFKKTHKLSFPVTVDSKLVRKFSSDGYPFLVLLDGQRRVRFTTKGIAAPQMIVKLNEALKR